MEGESSFEFLRYRDPFRNQLRRKEQAMRLVWAVILAHHGVYHFRAVWVVCSNLGRNVLVSGALLPPPPSRRFRTRIDTPGDQIRPGRRGGKSKERFHERGTPFVKTTPACRFVISCLITACTRTVVSPPFASDPRAYLLGYLGGMRICKNRERLIRKFIYISRMRMDEEENEWMGDLVLEYILKSEWWMIQVCLKWVRIIV